MLASRLLPVLAVLLCPVMWMSACGEGGGARTKKKVAGEPLALVGGEPLTVEEIQRRLDEQSPFVRARYADEAKKKEFLESQIKFEVLAQEAFARGIDQDPEVQASLKKVIVQKLTRDEFDNRVKVQDLTEDDLKAYYEAHKAEYDKPEQVRASLIVVTFGANKDEAKKTANEAQAKAAEKSKLEDRNAFRELVAKYSTDEASKRAGGDLRYLSRDEAKQRFGDAVEQWLFSSDSINDVSPVLETQDAFVVLKRTGKRKAITRTFEHVRNQVRNVVFREKRQASFDSFIEELKKKHGVQVFDDKLVKVKVSAEVPLPPPPTDDGHGHGHGLGAAPDDPDAPTPPSDEHDDAPEDAPPAPSPQGTPQ